MQTSGILPTLTKLTVYWEPQTQHYWGSGSREKGVKSTSWPTPHILHALAKSLNGSPSTRSPNTLQAINRVNKLK